MKDLLVRSIRPISNVSSWHGS